MIDISIYLTEYMLVNVIVGLVAGALRSLIGWLESGEDFDARKFSITLIRTSIVGALIAYSTVGFDPINLFFKIFFADFAITGLKKIEQVRVTKRVRNIK